MKKKFEELEINGELYSGTYHETETRSKLAWDEDHLSNLESVDIDLVTVKRYSPDFDDYQEMDIMGTEFENELKAKLGQY